MEQLVEYIVKQLVSEVDKVSVTSKDVDGVILVSIRVASADTGKVIGKQGRIAMAIRTIVRAAAIKTENRYSVEIVDSAE